MWISGLLKMGVDVAGHLPVLWVPDRSSPGTVQDGTEQCPEPRTCPHVHPDLGGSWDGFGS